MEQANGLVKRWLETSQKNDNGITLREARQDTGAVGLHVLASAAFGINYNFGRGAAPSEREHEMSFGMALKICMDNMAIGLVQVTFGLAKLGLPSWLLLHVMKNLRVAMYEMRDWIGKAIERERPERRQGGAAKDNFMSSLGRANEAEKDEHAKGRAKWTLNDIELQGNLFAISIAGHETTSGSLSNAIPCLAAHPEIQDWVRQEVDTVFRDGDVAYVDAMPRLVRIEALMVTVSLNSVACRISLLTFCAFCSTRLYGSSPPPRCKRNTSTTPHKSSTLTAVNTTYRRSPLSRSTTTPFTSIPPHGARMSTIFGPLAS